MNTNAAPAPSSTVHDSAIQPERRSAWEPFTPSGLAAFGKTSFGRVLLLLSTIGLISVATIIWFLQTAWFPAIRGAIHELPPQGRISHQELQTPRVSTEPLAEHRFLGFVVLVSDERSAYLNSHVGVKFRKRGVEICSIFGCLRFAYPRNWVIEFNRTDLEPGWGAWQPVVTALVGVVGFAGLLVLWLGLGFLYAPVPWMAARIKKRDLTWIGSWRMCSAGLIPGAILFVLAIWLYGFGILDVLQFVVLTVLQFVLGWVCIGFAWRALAPSAPPLSLHAANPFRTSREEFKSAEERTSTEQPEKI